MGQRRCPKAISFDNLPRINQRREVEAYDVHLKLDLIAVLNHGSNDSILDFPVVQIDADLSPTLNWRSSGLAGTRRMYHSSHLFCM